MISNREDELINSFGKQIRNNIVSFEDAINGSIFKPTMTFETSPPVKDFNMDNESICRDLKNKEGGLFSIKSSLVETRERSTCGTNSHILFSGYFGQRADDETFNGQGVFDKNAKTTNPFPLIEEEKVYNNSNVSYTAMNRLSSKRMKVESFNTGAPIGKNYFTELVKSVSLGNLHRKKSKICLI